MKDLLDAVICWPTLVGALIAFSLAPGIILQLMVRIYPHDHPRRRDLLADYAIVPRWERPFWVTEQFVTVTFEGIPTRYRARRERRDSPALPLKAGIAYIVRSDGSTGAVNGATLRSTVGDSVPRLTIEPAPWSRMLKQGRSSVIAAPESDDGTSGNTQSRK